jgi:hypothetical protein
MKVMGSQRRGPLHLLTASSERRVDGRDSVTPFAADLRAALSLVASRAASSVTLCGFVDDPAELRGVLIDSIDGDGLVIEPVVRPGGGGFDIRVRRASTAES